MAKIEDKIIQRIYIKGRLLLTSPLILGCGEDKNSNVDIVKDWEERPFIPGTSIAGALRHYLDEILPGEQELIKTVFGERKKDSTLSLVVLHDAFSLNSSENKINLRDGVKIDEITRTAKDKEKFEYEILESGVEFDFRAEVVIREKHRQDFPKIENLIYIILSSLQEKKICFGAKTRRGFGMVELNNFDILLLNMDSFEDDAGKWLEFDWNNFAGNKRMEDLTQDILTAESNIKQIKVDFSIPYTVLVRHYNAIPDYPDSTHLSCNGQGVIPGTSWAGVITHAIKDIARVLKKETEINEISKEMFGFVDPKEKDYKKRAKASRVSINESIVKDNSIHAYTRNKVDRFTGGVVDSALFTEAPSYQGRVSLDITVKEAKDYEIGLLLLALKDIGQGIAPVGGGANIGRGILKREGISIGGKAVDCEKYLKSLAKRLK